jgi:hypothetical protein
VVCVSLVREVRASCYVPTIEVHLIADLTRKTDVALHFLPKSAACDDLLMVVQHHYSVP